MNTRKCLRRFAALSLSLLLILALAGSALLWRYTTYFAGHSSHCSAEARTLVAESKQRLGIASVNLPCGQSRCLLLTPIPGATPDPRAQDVRAQLPAQGITPAPYGELQGIVVMLHGRGGCKENFIYPAIRLTAAGLAVIIPDLPGHGESRLPRAGYGTLPGEAQIAVDALDSARAHLHRELPAALWGFSMGSSYAHYSIAAHPHAFSALVVQAGFAHMDALLLDHLPAQLQAVGRPLLGWFALLVKLRGGVDIFTINPGDLAAAITLPVLQIHGEIDRLIPFTHGQTLAERYANASTMIAVADGDHNSALYRRTPVFAPAIAFILRHFPDKQ